MATNKHKEAEEFFEAVRLLCAERDIPQEYLLEKISAAIVHAVKKDTGSKDKDKEKNNVLVILDPENKEFKVSLQKTVVEDVVDAETEMLLDEAVKYSKRAKVGDVVNIPLQTKQFGRIAAQTAKTVLRQGLRDAERGQQLQEFQRRNQELVTAHITRVDPTTGAATLDLGNKAETVLLKSEQLESDVLKEGGHIKVFVADVRNNEKGPRALVSRTHPGLVKRLFELGIPEIFDGTVEIKAISREAGSRTKIAVCSKDENVDAVSACIGPRGVRINEIIKELGGEKIDVIEYNDDPVAFISAALAPAKVVSVEVDESGAKSCRASVPDSQLSLAIGNKGQNARLAARLTGWKIDIRPESGFYGEDTDEE